MKRPDSTSSNEPSSGGALFSDMIVGSPKESVGDAVSRGGDAHSFARSDATEPTEDRMALCRYDFRVLRCLRKPQRWRLSKGS